MDHFVSINHIVDDPTNTLQEATVDYHGLLGFLCPAGHRRMRHKGDFCITTTSIFRHFLSHYVGSKPCDFASDARTFTSKHWYLFLDHILPCPLFTCWAVP